MMEPVLVVGGSSGIGNGIAQAFRRKGADVHVWGTRASAADYAVADGSDLTGLAYTCVDVSDDDAVEAIVPAFTRLDVLVCCQGAVLYARGEFRMPGFRKVSRRCGTMAQPIRWARRRPATFSPQTTV